MTGLLLLWAALLLLQNASFTWVSRARNSGSDSWHAIAAVFSNGIWFGANAVTVVSVVDVVESGVWWQFIGLGMLYVVCTVTGSVVGGRIVRSFETGARRVGYYREGK